MEEREGLAHYTPLVLERAAVYHYAAGVNGKAAEIYRRLVELTEGGSVARRLKARMGLGAALAAAGQPREALRPLWEAQALLDDEAPFRPHGERSESHLSREDFRPLVLGLLAQALRAAGDLREAEAALLARRDAYQERLERYDRDAYLLELARIHQQLAELAHRTGRSADARRYLEEGLRLADAWRKRSGAGTNAVMVALVRSAAELHLYGGEGLESFHFDLRERLGRTIQALAGRTEPAFAEARLLLPAYLAVIGR